MAVDFAEFADSPVERYNPDGTFRATRKLLCAWDDRYDLVSEMAASGGHLYPYNTSLGARACGASIVPFGCGVDGTNFTGEIDYTKAEVTIEYAFTTYEPRLINNKMVIEELRSWVEYRAIDPLRCHVGAVNGPHPSRASRVLVAGADYSLTFCNVTSAPTPILTLPGYVNSSPFTTYRLGVAWPAKCLLYMGPVTRDEIRLGLTDKFQISLAFKFRSQEWSKELTEYGWQTIYNANGSEIYPTANFSLLTNVT